MAYLRCINNSNTVNEFRLAWENMGDIMKITAGSDAGCNLRLPSLDSILSKHAIFTRARAPVSFVLLDLSNGRSYVNDVPVFKMKALSHLDTIKLGATEFIFEEIHTEKLTDGSEAHSLYLGKQCMAYATSGHSFQKDDEIVVCRCGAAFHRACWFTLKQCSTQGCWYPIRKLIKKVLSDKVKFQIVEEGSDLLRKSCSGGQQRDSALFKEREEIILCPGCGTPFHVGCWLLQNECKACNFKVSTIADTVFSRPLDESETDNDNKTAQ